MVQSQPETKLAPSQAEAISPVTHYLYSAVQSFSATSAAVAASGV